MPRPSFSLRPETWQRTLELATNAIGLTEPNPRVGCVLLHPDGPILGEGFTQAAGDAHAEVMAMRAARSAGHDLRGAVAVVSLEPCAHHGRTSPCCDALIQAGIARVVVACEDPNPLVSGQGLARLRAAGVAVEVVGNDFEQATRELNIGFFSRMTRRRPWVRMKVAASLDGRTALLDGRSRWITGLPARIDGHAWRRRASAVLTGLGTVREDDPQLTVRHVATTHQPLRVVVDSRLEIDPGARVLDDAARTLLLTTSSDVARLAALRAARPLVDVALLPADAQGKNDLGALLDLLAQRGINELHIEAGERLNASFLRAGLVDELLLYVAPRLLGDGRGIAALGSMASLEQSIDFRLHDVARVGGDIRLILRREPPHNDAVSGEAPPTIDS